MKKPKYVYVQETNSIGVVIDSGKDNAGEWYRTDSDGVREASELLFLKTKKDVKDCINQLGANIAPSTKNLIGI